MSTRRSNLFFIMITILGALALSGSLAVLQLRGGNVSPLALPGFASGEPFDFTSLFWGEVIFRILLAFVVLSLLLFPVYLLHSLRSRQGRRRLLSDILALGFMLLLFGILYQTTANQEEEELVEEPQIMQPHPDEEFLGNPLAPEELSNKPPSLPSWTTWVAALGLAGLATLAAAYLFERGRAEPLPYMTLERLADEAQDALDALRAGGDVKDVIVRCYLAMSQALEEEKHIYRKNSMTPREFERVLVEKGLPRDPVKHLTHLFEEVRYGNRTPVRREEDLARLSLSEIVQHLRGSAS
jgi:hypothetical protein